MHCYNHLPLEAIGLCRNCFKGLCQDCCKKDEQYLVCSESCAQRVKDMEEMNERALYIYGIGKYATKRRFPLHIIFVIWFFCLGAFLTFLGISDMVNYNEYFSSHNILNVSVGVIFLFFAIFFWKRNKIIL
ncbi:MAG: hypothetical protein KA112_03670 [Alphaproteobacteria bacterium]|jgi:hypothetical protein|nr:hypothetical protein [Alphaproteobacteria bacterium]